MKGHMQTIQIPERDQERLRELDQELATAHEQAKLAAFHSLMLRRKARTLEDEAVKTQADTENALREYARKLKKRFGLPDGSSIDLAAMTITRPAPLAVPASVPAPTEPDIGVADGLDA